MLPKNGHPQASKEGVPTLQHSLPTFRPVASKIVGMSLGQLMSVTTSRAGWELAGTVKLTLAAQPPELVPVV